MISVLLFFSGCLKKDHKTGLYRVNSAGQIAKTSGQGAAVGVAGATLPAVCSIPYFGGCLCNFSAALLATALLLPVGVVAGGAIGAGIGAYKAKKKKKRYRQQLAALKLESQQGDEPKIMDNSLSVN